MATETPAPADEKIVPLVAADAAAAPAAEAAAKPADAPPADPQ